LAKELPDDKHGMKILKELEPLPEEKKEEPGMFKGLDQLYGAPTLQDEVKRDQDDKAKRVVEQFNKLKAAVVERDRVILMLKEEIQKKEMDLVAQIEAFDEHIKTNEKALADKDASVKDMERRMKENEEKTQAAIGERDVAAGSQKALGETILELKRTNMGIQNKANQIKEENQRLEKRCNELADSNLTLTGKIDILSEFQRKYEEGQARIEENKTLEVTLKAREMELEKDLKGFEKEKKTLSSKFEEMKGEFESLKKRTLDQEERIATLEKERNELKTRNEELDKEAKDLAGTLEQCETDALASEAREQELLDKEDALKVREYELNKAKEQLKKKEEELAAESQMSKETGKGKGRGKKKKKDDGFDATEAEIGALQTEGEELRRKMQLMDEENKRLKSEHNRLQSDLAKAQGESQGSQDQVASLRSELDNLKNELKVAPPAKKESTAEVVATAPADTSALKELEQVLIEETKQHMETMAHEEKKEEEPAPEPEEVITIETTPLEPLPQSSDKKKKKLKKATKK
jgi:chromosome segregation ATPase